MKQHLGFFAHTHTKKKTLENVTAAQPDTC